MELLDSLRFVLGASMLGYGAWTDHKTRRVPNQTWLISGTIASVLLAYEFTIEEYSLHIWALLVATVVLFYNAFVDEYVLDNNQMMLWRAVQVLGILCAAYFSVLSRIRGAVCSGLQVGRCGFYFNSYTLDVRLVLSGPYYWRCRCESNNDYRTCGTIYIIVW